MPFETSRHKNLSPTQIPARILVHLRKKYFYGDGENAPVYVDFEDLVRAVAIDVAVDADLERRIRKALLRLELDGLVGNRMVESWRLTDAGWDARKH